jgi:uncharacterized protein
MTRRRASGDMLRAALAVSLMVAALAGTAVAGPLEDAETAYERGDYATAFRLLRPLADNGNAQAQDDLGTMYLSGNGVAKDVAEAAKWYRKAADQGIAEAQHSLGNMYSAGQGVPQGYAEAAKWYRKAADQGYADAQNMLGVLYFYGRGVSRNYVQAHKWFNLAASRFPASDTEGRDHAVKNRDLVASKMTPAQIALAQKLAREWKPK